MKTFTYTIKDPVGIHARPAGLLAKKAKDFQSEIIIEKDERSANVKKLMALMGLGIVCGDTVTVRMEGPDEEEAQAEFEVFFKENL